MSHNISRIRNTGLAAVGLGVAVLLSAGLATAESDIVSDLAPPPLRAERAPAPRDGYIWGAGHWEWRGHAYSWVGGTWIAERRGAHWMPDSWEQVGGQWHYRPGHWQR
jgi:WXXGXW repeat (2 copies)